MDRYERILTLHRILKSARYPVAFARLKDELGCSRATLYRLFARRDQSVAAAVWQARLERALRMLCSAKSIAMTISDVAMLSGFTDIPTFTRMFKRRYGKTPREARMAWAEGGDERLG